MGQAPALRTGAQARVLYLLERHPLPIQAWFEHVLVLTYALPERSLLPLLPPGLVLDAWHGYGFVAIALVQTRRLRPFGVPAVFGQDFFLSGYRVFTRLTSASGRTLRGLRILRSDTDKPLMAFFGNLMTYYRYRLARVRMRGSGPRLEVQIATPGAEADLHVIAHLDSVPAPLPHGSPFTRPEEARRFAGPLPHTFDYEAETHSIVVIRGVRQHWQPELVRVEVPRCTFFRQPTFDGVTPILASAFHLRGVPYRWERGIREPLPAAAPA